MHFLYGVAGKATKLLMHLTVDQAVTVLRTTLAMCTISGLLGVRKVRRLDPADVF